MTRSWLIGAAQVLMVLGLAQGCKSDDDDAEPYECNGTTDECLNDLAGSYRGRYTGDHQGTWQASLDSSGNITGSVHNTLADVDLSLEGQTDENGNAVFGNASDGSTFQGRIGIDFGISGTWSIQRYSGTFSGSRVSSGAEE